MTDRFCPILEGASMKGKGSIGTGGITGHRLVGTARRLAGAAPQFALAITLTGTLVPNPTGFRRWIVQVQPGPPEANQSPRNPEPSGPTRVSFNQAQSNAQNKNEQPRPVKRVSPTDTIRKHMQRLGYGIDESKSRPDMIVSNYTDAKKGKVTIVMVYDKRKEVMGFYVYNFGNVDKAVDAGALNKYLLSANDEIIIGGFFVDKEGDIGYKYVSAVSQLSIASFEVIYVTMAGVALERRPQIRRLIETGKTEEGQRNNDAQVKAAGAQQILYD
jgi:hypothetical protein